uniref:PH domain-containing protein n=1 Tax=Heterorhabditis bacteriophora TaxID=37862 RepID=A0A1I7W894_HETBA
MICGDQEKRQPLPQRTRSLSMTPATDGDNKLNDEYYNLLTLQLLKGFTVWRVKAFNDRVYLERNRRSYWFGDRYFRLNATQRKDLIYEDGTPIFDIIYQ